MTQEEKAKAYDEALKIAQCWLNAPQIIEDCGYTVEDAIQSIFPVLKESEDERIRKEIISAILSGRVYDTDLIGAGHIFQLDKEVADKWIAYLEKQKEQKPILSDRDSTDFEIEVHEIIAQARNDSRLNDADVLKQFEKEAAFALMLKANKLIWQKPAEVDESTKRLNDNWMKQHFDDYKEQKPGEIPPYVTGIKGEPDPAGVWKPREEQMKALNEIVNILAASPFLHQNDYLFNILNGLREELKKLL